jgi:hypothetical protein
MQHHRRPSWSVEEHESREQGVWIARLVSSVLAAGWSAFWMGLACVLAGCVATLAVLHGPALASRNPPSTAPAAVASRPGESELRAVREELASLRQHATEMEARQHEERRHAAEERLAAAEERARAERLLEEERARRLQAEEERNRALEERATMPAPVVMAWPAPPPVMTPVELQAMLTQQLLQRIAMPTPVPMPVTIEPWPSAAP